MHIHLPKTEWSWNWNTKHVPREKNPYSSSSMKTRSQLGKTCRCLQGPQVPAHSEPRWLPSRTFSELFWCSHICGGDRDKCHTSCLESHRGRIGYNRGQNSASGRYLGHGRRWGKGNRLRRTRPCFWLAGSGLICQTRFSPSASLIGE